MKGFYGLIGYAAMVSLAFASEPSGIGAVANNFMVPVGMFSDFIYTGCIILGASFIFAGIIKFVEHRRSPLFVPLSTVVFLFVAGILLLLLPFAYKVINYAPPYSVFQRS